MSGNTLQQTNPDLVNWLSAHLQARYEPQFALANALSLPLGMAQLRGFWSMSSVNESGNVYDFSAQSRALTNNSASAFGVDDLAPYVDFDGTADYLSRADEAGLDITADLTIGGWFWADAAPGASKGLIGKWGAAGQRSYGLFIDSTPEVGFIVSSDGTAVLSSPLDSVSALAWYHIVGRFVPSTSVDLFVNGVKSSTVAAVPAAIFNSTSPLQVNGFAGAANFYDGRASLCFLCADSLSDAAIFAMYQQTRPLFNV